MTKRQAPVVDHLDATNRSASEPSHETEQAAPAVDIPERSQLPLTGRRRRRRNIAAAGPTPTSVDDSSDLAKATMESSLDDIGPAGDDEQPDATSSEPTPPARRSALMQAFSFSVVPLAALAVALGAAYLKYEDSTTSAAQRAGVESVQTATESTIAMLSYTPDNAQANLTAARDRLTGTFRDSYTSLTNDVVIPGAKEQKISATATVPAAASVSANGDHAVVLVYVNQAVVMGNGAPTETASVVQVSLDKVGNRWLVSGFDPK